MTPYHLDDQSRRLVPAVPLRCAWAEVSAKPCQVGAKSRRHRSTGPGFPVSILHCWTHGVCFTAYPPGHVPHGRRAVVNAAADGTVSVTARMMDQPEVPAPLEGTQLEAAWDAGHGRIWRRDCLQQTGQWLGTQVHRVEQSSRLSGVDADLDADAQLGQATALGVDVLTLREAQSWVRRKPGLANRGAAVVHVLKACLRRPGRLVQRLLAGGCLAGLWGRPYWWIPEASRLDPLVAT